MGIRTVCICPDTFLLFPFCLDSCKMWSMPPVCVVISCRRRGLTNGWCRINLTPAACEPARWGVSSNSGSRGKEWIKQKAHEETQWAVIGLCGFFSGNHFTEGAISFQNVGPELSHSARKSTRTQCWQIDICSSVLPVHVNELTFSILVMCLGSEEPRLVPGWLLSGLDWRGAEQTGPMCWSMNLFLVARLSFWVTGK